MIASISSSAVPLLTSAGAADSTVTLTPSPPGGRRGAPAHHRLRGGWSLDIRFRDERTDRVWDLANAQDQSDAIAMIKKEKPFFIMVCPPCTKCCMLQYLCDYQVHPVGWARAVCMVEFGFDLPDSASRREAFCF